MHRRLPLSLALPLLFLASAALLGLSLALGSVPISLPELASKNNCMACHHIDKKLVGPSYQDIAAKYKTDTGAEAKLIEKVRKGGSGVWGAIPMPPNALKDEDLRALVKWILAGASD